MRCEKSSGSELKTISLITEIIKADSLPLLSSPHHRAMDTHAGHLETAEVWKYQLCVCVWGGPSNPKILSYTIVIV